MRKALSTILVLLSLSLVGGLLSGCGDPAPPKDNSHVVDPPAPPPPGGPSAK